VHENHANNPFFRTFSRRDEQNKRFKDTTVAPTATKTPRPIHQPRFKSPH